MSLTKEKILEALKAVKDPSTGQDIVSLKMVEDLKIEGNFVQFKLALPQMNYPKKANINMSCMTAIQRLDPNVRVDVHMTVKPQNEAPKNAAVSHIKNIIAVASGKGGVGKTTVSVNLALALKRLGARVGLMDADLYGPSIPTMFNLHNQKPKVQEVYGKPKIVPLDGHGIPVISIGFIVEPQQAVVLRGPRLGGIIKQFFNDCLWPPLDYLIIDLPPGTGDIQLTLVQTVPVTGAVLVTTPQQVAIADAIKAKNMFRLPQINVPILGVVENMSWFTPEELPNNKYRIFGEGGGKQLAKESDCVLLGQVPLVQSVRESGDKGLPVVLQTDHPTSETFLEIGKELIRQVAVRNENLPQTEKVNMIN